MDISQNLAREFQRQYTQERINSAIYEALQNCAENVAWDGFAKFFKDAAKEELDHAEAFRSFLIDRMVLPKVGAQPAQDLDCKEPVEMVAKALESEKINTRLLLALYELCHQENDADAKIFLFDYIKEQRLAEKELADLLLELSRCGSNAAVLLIDARYRK